MASQEGRRPQFENVGALITYRDEDGDRCLGYLVCFERHGVYEPSFGRVDVTRAQAEVHNKVLHEAMLRGLDETCEIGMGGSFYVSKQDGRLVIKTFLGALVSNECTQHGRVVTFTRAGKQYRGRRSRDHDLFHFRRVA